MRTILAPTLALALLLAGCLGGDDAPADDPATNESGEDESMEGAAPEDITVTVGRAPGVGVPPTTYTLTPATLELMVGQAYNLTLVNDDAVAGHDLVIEGLDVHIDTIGAGATSDPVQFTPTEAGEFRMYCSIGQGNPTGHDEMGMHGTVVVSEMSM